MKKIWLVTKETFIRQTKGITFILSVLAPVIFMAIIFGVVFISQKLSGSDNQIDNAIVISKNYAPAVKDLKICGVKQFFDDDIRTIVFLFKTNHFAGKLQSSREGEVFWIERKDLENYQLADGFDSMLEIFENDNLSENCWYLKDSQWTYKNE